MVARDLRVAVDTVRKWCRRFLAGRLDGRWTRSRRSRRWTGLSRCCR
ncbi:hypothetical protein ACFCZY_00270 [Streptomyces sp. NPDC056237]